MGDEEKNERVGEKGGKGNLKKNCGYDVHGVGHGNQRKEEGRKKKGNSRPGGDRARPENRTKRKQIGDQKSGALSAKNRRKPRYGRKGTGILVKKLGEFLSKKKGEFVNSEPSGFSTPRKSN